MIILQNKISKQEVSEMPKVSFSGRIFVIYTETEARKAIDYLNTHSVVGVDTETRPSFRKGMTHKVALLQIATYDTCFLFRLNHLGLPDFLEEFLQNDVLKVGLSLRDDFAVLRKRNGGDLRDGNWIELQDYVPHFGIEEKSLQKSMHCFLARKYRRRNAFPIGRQRCLLKHSSCMLLQMLGHVWKFTVILKTFGVMATTALKR